MWTKVLWILSERKELSFRVQEKRTQILITVLHKVGGVCNPWVSYACVQFRVGGGKGSSLPTEHILCGTHTKTVE